MSESDVDEGPYFVGIAVGVSVALLTIISATLALVLLWHRKRKGKQIKLGLHRLMMTILRLAELRMILHWSMITHDRTYKLHVHVWCVLRGPRHIFGMRTYVINPCARAHACCAGEKKSKRHVIAQNFVIMLAVIGSLLFASVAVSTGEPLHVGYVDIHDTSDLYRTAV